MSAGTLKPWPVRMVVATTPARRFAVTWTPIMGNSVAQSMMAVAAVSSLVWSITTARPHTASAAIQVNTHNVIHLGCGLWNRFEPSES